MSIFSVKAVAVQILAEDGARKLTKKPQDIAPYSLLCYFHHKICMGNKHGKSGHNKITLDKHQTSQKKETGVINTFHSNPDKYKSLGEVQEALQKSGLEASQCNNLTKNSRC